MTSHHRRDADHDGDYDYDHGHEKNDASDCLQKSVNDSLGVSETMTRKRRNGPADGCEGFDKVIISINELKGHYLGDFHRFEVDFEEWFPTTTVATAGVTSVTSMTTSTSLVHQQWL